MAGESSEGICVREDCSGGVAGVVIKVKSEGILEGIRVLREGQMAGKVW